MPQAFPATLVPGSLISAAPLLWPCSRGSYCPFFVQLRSFLVSHCPPVSLFCLSCLSPRFPLCLGSPFLQGSPAPRTVPCWPGVCLFAFSFPLCLCSRPLISPLLCSGVFALTPAPGGLASLLSPCAVSRKLVGVEARSGVCDQARKENPSRHDIYVETSKWSPGCGGGGWGLASKSQTKVSSCSSPARVSLVIHTSPVGHQTQSRDEMGYFGAEFQERHFLYPHPAPIFFPVTLQLGLGSLVPPPLVSIPQLGIQGVLEMAGWSKGFDLSKKTSQALGQSVHSYSHFLAEAPPGRAARVCNPISPTQGDQTSLAFPDLQSPA